MTITIRRGAVDDAPVIGDICYRAFKTVAEAHGFPPDFPSGEAAAGMLAWMIRHPGYFDMVAEADGVVIGSNMLDERNPIGGVGPITVDPAVQNDGAGRALMAAVIERAEERRLPGVRLLQAGYHTRSLALYAKLGFEAREHIACFQGPPLGETLTGYGVRQAVAADLEACNDLCFQIHGHHRGGELADAVGRGSARVVERRGRVTGYSTAIAFPGHAVGDTNDDVMALIAEATSFPGAGFLVPTRNGALVRWCLSRGLRVTQPLTLMTMGLYNEPKGAWLPSIVY